MSQYNSGPMPGTDLRYEDFEGFLASYALSVACLKTSGRTSDDQDYAAILGILDGFAERHGVQPPLATLQTPRSKKGLAKPQEFGVEEMIHMVNSFGQDFKLGLVYPGRKLDLDAAERRDLGRILMNVLDRYALADLVYANERGIRVPVRIKRWTSDENRRRKLAEAVREWKNWRA